MRIPDVDERSSQSGIQAAAVVVEVAGVAAAAEAAEEEVEAAAVAAAVAAALPFRRPRSCFCMIGQVRIT